MTVQLDRWHYINKVWTIENAEDLIGKEARVHWHFMERRYSVSLRAPNGRWYVVRSTQIGHPQLYFGKLILKNVRFRVQPAAALKAYKTNRRSVHATLTGEVLYAQYEPEGVIVPCGYPVAYSHNLYPEPEFKVNIFDYEGSFFDRPMKEWPGIFSADMAAMGVRLTDQHLRKPQMLVAGELQLYTKDF